MTEAILLAVALCIAVLILSTQPYRSYYRPQKRCEDDPSKRCPYTCWIDRDGGFGCVTETLVLCCRFEKQIEAIERLERRLTEQDKR